MAISRRKSLNKPEDEDEEESGDCNDEDDCGGDSSGNGGLRVKNQLRFLAELAYDLDTDDIPSNKQLLNQQSKKVSTVHNFGSLNAVLNVGLSTALLTALFLLLVK